VFAVALLVAVCLSMARAAPARSEEAASGSTRSGAATPQLWGVEVGAADASILRPATLAKLRQSYVNALVLDPAHLTASRLAKARAAARRARLLAVLVLPTGKVARLPAGRAVTAACRRKKLNVFRCASSRSGRQVLSALRPSGKADYVAARLSTPAAVARLAAVHGHRRVLALVALRLSKRFPAEAWAKAIAAARRDPELSLGVTPSGKSATRALTKFLQALKKAAKADKTRPSAPAPKVTAVGQHAVTIAWAPATDDVAVVSYGAYLDGALVAATTATTYTFDGLDCGTAYDVGADAVDAAGNRSTKGTVHVQTTGCSAVGSDLTPPSQPGPIVVSAATTTTVSFSWAASADNVAVAGYTIYRNGHAAGTTGGTSFTLSGLACSSSYSVDVEAYDAAGNTSPRRTATVATASCSLPAASVFVSASGSDSNPCSQASPCKSFNRAYHVAAPGSVVEVAGGTYAAQTISSDASKTSSSDVVFRPAAGQTVTFSGDLTIDAQHLELRDMTFVWEVLENAHDVTLRNIAAHGEAFMRSDGTDAPSDISVLGGEIGPGVDGYPAIGTNGFSTTAVPTNITFDGVYFHDWTLSQGSSAHVECLQVWGADGLTIRNSRFQNCWVFDIFMEKLVGGSAPTPTNITIENNFLDCCGGGDNYAIRLSDTSSSASWQNVTIRNNSSDQKFNLGPGASYSNVKVLSNIAKRIDGTPSGTTIDYNDWYGGSKVGSHDFVAATGFVNTAGFDYHLAAGAAAIDKGSPSSFPPTDIDGDTRPAGSAPDAGADEYTGTVGSPPPPPAPPPPPPPPGPPPPPPPPGSVMYVRAGASGNGSGSDWTNACTDFTGSCAVSALKRGDTYYVAGGHYASRNFNTAASGSQTITIKGATVGEHGTATGWSDSYAVGTGNQAHFGYPLYFRGAQYFVFDGATSCNPGGTCGDPNSYGFVVDQPAGCGDQAYVETDTGTIAHDTWAHIALSACGGDVGRTGFDSGQATEHDNTYSHVFCSGMEACIDLRAPSGQTVTNTVIEYVYAQNAFTSPTHHGETFNLLEVDGITIRDNVLPDCHGTACIAANDAGSCDVGVQNASIYGNVIGNADTGNGMIGATSVCWFKNTSVFNNTFYSGSTSWWFGGCVPGSGSCSNATGNVAENNVVFDMTGDVGGGVGTKDYNSYFRTTGGSAEAHGQTSSSDPFVNSGAGDMHLAADTSAWTSAVPAGDTVDMDGYTRTSSRGAYQYH
jgi:chitodextrinase